MEYFFTILSVVIGGGISLYGVHISENRKEKREKRKERIEQDKLDLIGRKKTFHILEELKSKCEMLLREEMGYCEPLNLNNIPTFRLIDKEKALEIKFFLHIKYKNKYKDFIALENRLIKLKEQYATHNYEFDRRIQYEGDRESEYRKLSETVYQEVVKIIKSIELLKEKI